MLNHMVLHSAQLDRVFHALAHPARRTIIQQLRSGEKNLSELAAPLKMSFPAVSKHVKVLEGARLVARRISGRAHICRLEAAPFQQVADYTEQFRQLWEQRFDALDDLLAQMQREQKGPEKKSGRKRPG